MIAQLAVLVYGAVTILIAVAFAFMQHSALGMALVFAAAGITYLFQFLQMFDVNEKLQNALIVISIALTLASALASLAGV